MIAITTEEIIEKINPVKDWCLVEIKDGKTEKIGDIILPETNRFLSDYAVVLKVGPGRRSLKTGEILPMELKIGDVIYVSNFSRFERVKNPDKRFLFLVPEPLVDGKVEE
jgi:co-chaperonin GroES (HSP10)